ncbi:MAG: CopG family transcriptional regulator [Candidatus Omnitrophica bacterium]|nr:CopG family transcriptional regulator [Candidatus Omnitrophota bacterium]
MATAKVAITLEQQLLRLVDQWVSQRRFASRSQAIQVALREEVEHWKRTRLVEEVKKLNLTEERALAEERSPGEEWPEY